MQEVGCEALGAIVKGQADIQRWALQAGALEVCKAAVTTRFPQHPGVRRSAKRAMECLSKGRTARICDLGSGMQSPLLEEFQARMTSMLRTGGADGSGSDWMDLLELAVTTDWKEWESGLSTASVAAPAFEGPTYRGAGTPRVGANGSSPYLGGGAAPYQ